MSLLILVYLDLSGCSESIKGNSSTRNAVVKLEDVLCQSIWCLFYFRRCLYPKTKWYIYI